MCECHTSTMITSLRWRQHMRRILRCGLGLFALTVPRLVDFDRHCLMTLILVLQQNIAMFSLPRSVCMSKMMRLHRLYVEGLVFLCTARNANCSMVVAACRPGVRGWGDARRTVDRIHVCNGDNLPSRCRVLRTSALPQPQRSRVGFRSVEGFPRDLSSHEQRQHMFQ